MARERPLFVESGWERFDGIVNAALVAFALVMGFSFARQLFAGLPWAAWIGAGALIAVLAAGSRWRLTVRRSGVELVQVAGWFVPWRRHGYRLDSDVELYESFEADGPEGLCISPRHYGFGERESRCFAAGLPDQRLRDLMTRANEALDDARRAAPRPTMELRNPLLAPHLAALDLAGAERDPRGRLRRVRSVAPLRLRDLEVPAGSVFELNGGEFLDPSRPDRLLAIGLAAAVRHPGLGEIPAGTTVGIGAEGRLSHLPGVLAPELLVEGLWIDGSRRLSWHEDGRLCSATLARELVCGAFRIPAGSDLLRTGIGGPDWRCTLAAAVAFPEFTAKPGDSLVLASDWSRVVAVSPKQDLVLGDYRVRTGIVNIPLLSDGRVDREACERYRIGSRSG